MLSDLWIPRRELIKPKRFLPGWHPGHIGAGGDNATPLTLSFRSSSLSTGETITAPSDIVSGDVIFLLDRALAGKVSPSEVIAAGFTSISSIGGSGSGTNSRQIVSYKIADGSEASANITGMLGSSQNKIIAVFQGDSAIGSVSIQSIAGETTPDNPASQAVTSAGGTPALIVFGCYGSNGAISPRTWTGGTATELNSADNETWLNYEIFNTSPANITVDMDDEGGVNFLQSFYAECSA